MQDRGAPTPAQATRLPPPKRTATHDLPAPGEVPATPARVAGPSEARTLVNGPEGATRTMPVKPDAATRAMPGKTMSMSPTEVAKWRDHDVAQATQRSHQGFDAAASGLLGPSESQRLAALRNRVLERNSQHGWVNTA